MIIRARTVVPITAEPIDDGAVVKAGNKIADVGRFREIRARFDEDTLDLGEQILMPGLINAHCHLDYTMLRGKIPPQKSFTDWIRAINAEKAGLADSDYLQAITSGMAEAQGFGSTSLVNLEAYPALLSRLPQSPLRIWWCAEMIDVREPVLVRELYSELADWFQSNNPSGRGGVGLAPHALYTASKKLYSEASAIAGKQDLLTTHVAESRDEMQMFHNGEGPLYEFLKTIGRPMDDCDRSETPISHLIATQSLHQNWIIAHLNEIAESDFDLLARSEKFNVVHCPRSHAFFGHTPFPLQRLQKLGFNICLGTDSLASNSNLSLFAEMRELLNTTPSLSPRDVLTMATINGAAAIGYAGGLGEIKPGSRADLIAFPDTQANRTAPGLLDKIVGFEGKVPWLMVDGQILPPQ